MSRTSEPGSAPHAEDAVDALAGMSFTEAAGHTFPELYEMRLAATPDRVAVHAQGDGAWATWTWRELGAAADAIAVTLDALGVARGDRVGIMTSPRVEGLAATWAAQKIGAVPCGVYANTDGDTLSYLVDLAEISVLLVEREEFLDRALRSDPTLSLRAAIVFDGLGGGPSAGPERRALGDMLADGRGVTVPSVTGDSPDDPCAIYFTSGTTGRPKAVVLSHRNILSSYFAAFGDGPGQLPQPAAGDRTLHDIQLGSVAGADFGLFFPLLYGCETFVPAEGGDPLAVLREVEPTIFLAFPRTWEQLAAAVVQELESAPSGDVTHALSTVGLGGVTYAMCGGLSVAAVEQWRAWGVVVRGIYGMNESGGLATMQTEASPPPGAAGPALPGVELVLDTDGEILLRGAAVFSGYLGSPEATADALDPDGWLHTGDIGTLDPDGTLRVVDRKNDMITLADGTTVSTSDVANALKRSRYVKDALVVGTDRAFCGALIEPALVPLREWAVGSGAPAASDAGLTQSDAVRALMADQVDAANALLAAEGKPTVDGFRVLPRELDANDPSEVTATRKLRRQNLAVKFADLIEDLYGAVDAGAR